MVAALLHGIYTSKPKRVKLTVMKINLLRFMSSYKSCIKLVCTQNKETKHKQKNAGVKRLTMFCHL